MLDQRLTCLIEDWHVWLKTDIPGLSKTHWDQHVWLETHWRSICLIGRPIKDWQASLKTDMLHLRPTLVTHRRPTFLIRHGALLSAMLVYNRSPLIIIFSYYIFLNIQLLNFLEMLSMHRLWKDFAGNYKVEQKKETYSGQKLYSSLTVSKLICFQNMLLKLNSFVG